MNQEEPTTSQTPTTHDNGRLRLSAAIAASALTLLLGSLPGGVAPTVKADAQITMRDADADEDDRDDSVDYMAMVGHVESHAQSTTSLQFSGAVDGIAVTIGRPRVYLVFWGSQWGRASTESSGSTVLTGDPKGAAPYLQQFYAGLGRNGETWSGVVTQYCEGIPKGATSCPITAPHVGYPTGGALAGVWVDSSRPAPAQATGDQIAAEAIAAASHFGNTTPASNRSVQYHILSAAGTNPDGFPGAGFCAYHTYTRSSYGDLAYTNMPYVTDAGRSCGQGFVNSSSTGVLDGFSIIGGHEYAETLTDQNPAGGWLAADGEENGDLCSWVTSGPGRVQNLRLSTGTFAVQGTWSNDDAGCQVSHPVFAGTTASANPVVTNPGAQAGARGKVVNLHLQATDPARQPLTWTATGLPPQLVVTSAGDVFGVPGRSGTYTVTVTATDTGHRAGSATFTWTVK